MNKKWSGLPTVLFGNGGIAGETLKIINDINLYNNQNIFDIQGFISEKEGEIGKKVFKDYCIISCDEKFEDFSKQFPVLGVVVPSGFPNVKKKIFSKLKNINNLAFPNIVHPTVKIDKLDISLGIGNIIAEGVKFTTKIKVGDFNLLNLGTVIGHNSIIENFCVLNSLCSISGNVHISSNVLVGTSSTILQGITIDESAKIGASSLVIKNVKKEETVIGVPARRVKA